MTNIQELSVEELQKLLAEAQLTLEVKRQGKKKEVIAQIKELAASIGVTVEIFDSSKAADKRMQLIQGKYRNPHNHLQTWTGRGLSPKWLRELIEAGHSKEEFLINN